MKLKTFKEKTFKSIEIIIFTIFCFIFLVIGVIFYSFNKEFNRISDNHLENLYFAYFIDDKIVNEMPTKESGYTLSSKSSCNNGVTISWDKKNWSALVNYSNYQKENNSRTKCNLYFEIPDFNRSFLACGQSGKSAANCFMENQDLNENELVYDHTSDNNLRYVGVNPNNYVDLGEVYTRDVYHIIRENTNTYVETDSLDVCNGSTETCIKAHSIGDKLLWRIIGIFNHIDNGSGKKETRLKLIRDDYAIFETFWEDSDFYSDSNIMNYLNTTFYDTLNSEIKTYISDATWNLGMYDVTDIVLNLHQYQLSIKSSELYQQEHGVNTIEGMNPYWTGKFGITQISDVVYALGEESLEDKNNCLSLPFYDVSVDVLDYCYEQNWLRLNSNMSVWCMNNSLVNSNYPLYSFLHGFDGYFIRRSNCEDNLHSSYGKTNGLSVYPTVFLDASTLIQEGNGTLENPFILTK